MLGTIRRFFEDNFPTTAIDRSEAEFHPLQTATTVLFLEMVHADFELSPAEYVHLKKILQDTLKLSEDETFRIIEAARLVRNNGNDLWRFTTLLKNELDRPEKQEILVSLWELIYIDGHVDKYEESLIRKITVLLGMEHGEMIQAKLEAQKRIERGAIYE